ncbi:glutenin, high molecular weight subunit DX5-like [Stylophora pistillata]|uniref:glutenin, high molecular weight subunit DX5-like n=1 Tax=Stylophora pistillata TaxID=50429 RepID=UPI000C053D90|nr:glutenin, high molecular weight subunit DX5-like [Stylophora pistillata]
MRVFGYFGTVFLVYASQLLAALLCQADAKFEESNIKFAQRNPTLKKYGNKYNLGKDLKHNRIVGPREKEDSSAAKSKEASSIVPGGRIVSKGHINTKKNGQTGDKAADKLTRSSTFSHTLEEAKESGRKSTATPTNGRKATHSKKSKLSKNLLSEKSTKTHEKDNIDQKKKKKLFKKYALVQSFSPLQSSEEYLPIAAGGGDQGYGSLIESDQTGDVRDQGQAQEQQQQQIGYLNSMSQYDSAGYQQGSQSSDTNVAQANNNDAGQIEGGQQPSSLEQAIQLQQESYTQHPQEQGQEEQGTELVGQEGQATDGGQLQYQSEQTGQEQEQGGQEGVQEQGRGQTGFEQSEYQQEQAPDPNEQQSHSQGLEQQLQQQAQSQEYQPQAQEEPQESEGAPVESQTLATSSNSLGNLFSSEGQQTAEQEGQGTVSYSSEQPIEGAEKGAPPGIQYASSIEEALKEPAETPPESSNDGGENQGSIGGTDSANAINIGGGSDSKEENNGYIGAGTVTAPSTYQSAAFDDNGNTLQPGTSPDANAYASENDQTSNSEATGFDGNQPSPSASPPEEQGSYGLAGQQFKKPGPGPKVPSLEDDFYKIINIANKNGPMAVKGCKGCPPHAKCIDKVCIINDDQPLAHMLNALSVPDPGMHVTSFKLTFSLNR